MKRYRVIPLTKGYVAIIDAEDYRRVNRHSWHTHFSAGTKRKPGHPYARATIDGKKVYLHRFVMGDPPDQHVDHRNWQTLDCRKENLKNSEVTENIKRRRKNGVRCQHDQADMRPVPEESGSDGVSDSICCNADKMLDMLEHNNLL